MHEAGVKECAHAAPKLGVISRTGANLVAQQLDSVARDATSPPPISSAHPIRKHRPVRHAPEMYNAMLICENTAVRRLADGGVGRMLFSPPPLPAVRSHGETPTRQHKHDKHPQSRRICSHPPSQSLFPVEVETPCRCSRLIQTSSLRKRYRPSRMISAGSHPSRPDNIPPTHISQ